MTNVEELLQYLDKSKVVVTTLDETPETVIQTFKPTTHQQDKLNELKEWYYSDSLFIVLDGAAGTGKTSIIDCFISNVVGGRKKIVLIAPTHKALNVVRPKINSNCEFITNASAIGMRPDDNLEKYDPTKTEFIIKANRAIEEYDIAINDEGSMIPAVVIEALEQSAIKEKIKILYIADEVQLPAVGEYISAVFKYPRITLTEIIRQKNTHPLTYLLAVMRENILDLIYDRVTINNVKYEWINILNQNSKVINEFEEGYCCISYDNIENYIHIFEEDKFTSKYLTFANKDVLKTNRIIRNRLYPNSTKFVEIGELFMAYSTISDDKLRYKLTNSIDYLITDIAESSLFFKNVIVENKKYNFKTEILQYDEKGDIEIKGYKATIQSEENNRIITQTIFIPNKDSYNTIGKEHVKYHNDNNIGVRWQMKPFYGSYKEFRSKLTLITDIFKDSIEFKHYDNTGSLLKIISKDLDRAYSITKHKSQGSTYKNTIVNIKETLDYLKLSIDPNVFYKRYGRAITDIDIKNEITFHLRLIYVALSRVTKISYIIIK